MSQEDNKPDNKYNKAGGKDCGLATKSVRAGMSRSRHAETSEALYLTSGFVYESAEEAAAAFSKEKERYVYGRYGSPTVTMFEDRLKAIEGAKVAFATSTGMAAAFLCLASFLKSGDRVVAAKQLFSSSTYIISTVLARWGISHQFVDGANLDQWAAALSQPTQAVLFETPSNPLCDLVDIRAVSDLAHKAGARVIVDNVFASPILQSPLDLGADMVFYSATKSIDGQGRVFGGAVLLNDEDFAENRLRMFLKHTGAGLSAFNAWVLLKGLETLKVRIEAQSIAAAKVADFLESHPKVQRVHYPGLASCDQHDLAKRQMKGFFGNMLAFAVKDDRRLAFKVLNSLKLIDISNNLGDVKSLICHPASTTHYELDDQQRQEQGIHNGQIRMSVGLEDLDDLLQDLDQALNQS